MSVLKNKACLAHAVIPPSRAAATSAQRDTPAVIAPPPLIYLVALATGFVLAALLPSASVPPALSYKLLRRSYRGSPKLVSEFLVCSTRLFSQFLVIRQSRSLKAYMAAYRET